MTHSIERLTEIHQLFLGTSPEKATSTVVEEVSAKGSTVILKLQNVTDRTAAEKFIGCFIFVKEENIKQPKKGSYFIHEIIGCGVWSDAGKYIGDIRNVLKMLAQDVWEIQKDDKLYMIPVVKEFIMSVDIKAKKVVVQLIDGLIEE
ncbi:MAG: ribosome maturation factor RimM [Bacteroidota bacterium]|nr:ribosome maturation factor RimM [Bacteroidota bacterium]